MSPLAGLRILVTRRPEQAEALTTRLRDLGATVSELPLIEIGPPSETEPLDRALGALRGYDWIAFTSANAVEAVARRCADLGVQGPLPRVAVVGPATREAVLRSFPMARVEVEPPSAHRAEGLVQALGAHGRVEGSRFLVPTSDKARDTLAQGLRDQGAVVDWVVAYRTGAPEGLEASLRTLLSDGLDLVVFASPSAVDGFVGAAAGRREIAAAVIGPVTEQAARAAGFDVKVVADPSTADGLVGSLIEYGRSLIKP